MGVGVRSANAGPRVPGLDRARAKPAFADLTPVTPAEAPAVMWEHVGLFRTAAALRTALARLGTPPPAEEASVTVGRLIPAAAPPREERPGAQCRLHFPPH